LNAVALIPRYVERVKALTVGDPADPATIVGPLINTWRAAYLEARQGRRRQGSQPAYRRRSDRGTERNAHQAGRPHRRDHRQRWVTIQHSRRPTYPF